VDVCVSFYPLGYGMPTCKQCQQTFPNYVMVEGALRNLCNRHYCLQCSPFKMRSKNTRDIPTSKRCPRCTEELPEEAFGRRKGSHRNGRLMPYCKRCTAQEGIERQRRLKQLCVTYKGGQCCRCGYSKSLAALDFHHRDPTQKDFSISRYGLTSWSAQLQSELDKCELLCANCHREAHDAYMPP